MHAKVLLHFTLNIVHFLCLLVYVCTLLLNYLSKTFYSQDLIMETHNDHNDFQTSIFTILWNIVRGIFYVFTSIATCVFFLQDRNTIVFPSLSLFLDNFVIYLCYVHESQVLRNVEQKTQTIFLRGKNTSYIHNGRYEITDS